MDVTSKSQPKIVFRKKAETCSCHGCNSFISTMTQWVESP